MSSIGGGGSVGTPSSHPPSVSVGGVVVDSSGMPINFNGNNFVVTVVDGKVEVSAVKVYEGGVLKGTDPPNFNGNDFNVTVNAGKLDIALTKILAHVGGGSTEKWQYVDSGQAGGFGDLIAFDGTNIAIGQNTQTAGFERGVKIHNGGTASCLEVVNAADATHAGKTRLGGPSKRIQFDETGLTTLRNFQFPDTAGTVALASDLTNVFQMPANKTWGVLNGRKIGDPNYGWGLLSDMITYGTQSGSMVTSHGGTIVQHSTGTTINTLTGETTRDPIVAASLTPALFARLSYNYVTITDTLAFCGFSQDSSLDNSDDPLNNFIGIGLQKRPNITELVICHNNGGTTDNQVSTGVESGDSDVFAFYLYKVEDQSIWRWYIWQTNNGDIRLAPTASGEITTLIPTGGEVLYFLNQAYNKAAANLIINRNLIIVSNDVF